MKKFLFFVACAATLAICATSCYQSKVEPLGENTNLVSFTKKIDKTTEYVGVKNTLSNVVIVEPVYEVVYYKLDYIIAAKANNFAIFDNTGQRMFEDLNIIEAGSGKNSDFFTFKVPGGKYFFLPHCELCGPAKDFTYYPTLGLLFAENEAGKYGIYDPDNGNVILEQKYQGIIYAYTDAGQSAYYIVDGKSTKKLVNGTEKVISNANLNAMKKEAETNKTPWPKSGIGVVKVKTLR